MKIKMIKKLPRLLTIPGDLSTANYRELQAGVAVEVSDEVAAYLMKPGYAATITGAPEQPKTGEDNG
jgi:hypothetical protein